MVSRVLTGGPPNPAGRDGDAARFQPLGKGFRIERIVVSAGIGPGDESRVARGRPGRYQERVEKARRLGRRRR